MVKFLLTYSKLLYCCNTTVRNFEKKEREMTHLKYIFQTASKQSYVAIVLNISKHRRLKQRVEWLQKHALVY